MRLTQIGLIIIAGVLMAIIDVTPYLRAQKAIKKAKEEEALVASNTKNI